ncbi:Chemotaxis protein histidine kinase CheA [Paucidesulfovibrio gracilis DSM 16080]|uniref:Chemotaxis protein CheA n=1 Tax=Paucidesulfovibrio gracilis DSM 16080 TaxID=1121449 RepID=A0A1T4WSK1_9BACT|nr:chemotaxis protein CheA [Paucidesulfovibrio gracilis]SKA80249.1 Chemotaxis protein histidine kinase CheA [Paucidesulfovibrio gracilis DSM 16080]
MTDDINRQIFREEAYELLAELETTLLELEGQPDDMDIVNRVFRSLHTIKGSGSMFGFEAIAGFTHEVESVFDMVRNGELPISRPLLDQAFSVRDHIQRMLDEGGGEEVDPERAEALLKQLRQIAAGDVPAEPVHDATAPDESAGESVEDASESSAVSKSESTPPEEVEQVVSEETDSPDLSRSLASSSDVGNAKTDSVVVPQGGGAGTASWHVRVSPKQGQTAEGFQIVPLLEELAKLGPCEVRADDSLVPLLGDYQVGQVYLAWDVYLETSSGEDEIKDVFFFSDAPLDVQVTSVDPRKSESVPAQPPSGEVPPEVAEGGWELLEDDHGEGQDSAADLPLEPAAQDVAKPQGTPLEQKPAVVPERINESEPVTPPAPAKPSPAPKSSTPKVPQAKKETGGQQRAAGKTTPTGAPAQQGKGAATGEAARQQDAVSSIRVAAEKLDSLVDLVGELVIVQAQISQLSLERDDAILKRLAEDLERLSDELRDSALSVRMLPIGTSFSKFRRLVRDLSSELGKEIQLTTAGADTELDKTVIERLADPLVHLLRNSIDHGVESPEERTAAGKPSKATIHLAAEHSGGEVLIRIQDDGKGIDSEVIREKALERGLVSADADLSHSEILNLIFEPGFSTAQKVTSVSGRGVGMDVVKRAIDALRGRIVIHSERGKGTEITIRLPLTLAIIDGLQVLVGEEYFVVPLAVVEECVELRAEDEEGSDGRILYLRGEIVPYVQLREWFEIDAPRPDIEQVVIVGLEGRRVGIVVDKVIGEHQTVIKSLGKVYKDVDGISGATIKGDGSIALILDVPGLMKRVVAESD